jgi:hypothetical protein
MARPKLLSYLAAAAVLAIALGSAALGANPNANANAASALEHGAAVSLPDQASRVASAVLGALTGGSNPSTVAASAEHTANVNALDAKADKADKATEKASDQADVDEAKDNDVSKGQASKPASTTGTKPGWGCGDDNHTHSGPPGRPGATMPPGCAKAKSH